MKSIDVIQRILEINQDIRELSFHEFPPSVMIQEEISDWGVDEQRVFDGAVALKKAYGLPFWNGIMLSEFNNPHFSKKMLHSALHHNPVANLKFVNRDRVRISMRQSYALCSKVKKENGTEMHIPLFDFHIPPSSCNLDVVIEVCKTLGLNSGWILNSGESYHFIGSNPIKWDDLHYLLCEAIVFNPIVDTIWISHQLREKCCSLRIGEKHGIDPTVVFYFDSANND